MLAIEHNWHLRKVIKANLETQGFEVREAVSVQHGLQRLDEGRPDLVLLDLDLPGWLNVLRAVRGRFRGEPVPVVLISAEPPNRDVLQRAEVVGHLLKPFAVPTLLEQVQGLFDRPADKN